MIRNKNEGVFLLNIRGEYLFCDGSGTIDELSLGETVGGGDLQSSGFLDQEDAAVSELLHPGLDLETDLNNMDTVQHRSGS